MERMMPKKTVIDGYEIKQAENFHVTITRLEDGKTVFHAQCNEEKDAQQMLDFYKTFPRAKQKEVNYAYITYQKEMV